MIFLAKNALIGCLSLFSLQLLDASSMSISPKDELKVYQALIRNMPDQLLVQKYKEEYERLQKNFKNSTKDWGLSEVSQLPIFKIAVLKSILAEIYKRQEVQNKLLLPKEQFTQADKLIKKEEERINKGIKSEKIGILETLEKEKGKND